MDNYFVLGNPVAHSMSPLIHARFAQLAAQLRHPNIVRLLDADESAEPPYLVFEYVSGPTLAQLVKGGACGCNVTVPFKFEAFQAAHTQSDRAQLAQAANTLSFAHGQVHADNTDGIGLVNDIQNNAGVSLAGRDVLLIGAGGAAAGALGALLAAGPRRLVLVNRTRARADALSSSTPARAA